jgi:hypothetical protein
LSFVLWAALVPRKYGFLWYVAFHKKYLMGWAAGYV